jgi:Mitochondrial carrier protein
MKENYPVYITSISSFIAGGISRALVYPIDTVKAKLQVQQANKSPQFKTISGALKVTLKEESVRGLYKGMLMSILVSLPANTIYFSAYEASKIYLTALYWPTFFTYFTAGMIAEVASCAIFVPMDVIKERLQVQSNIKQYKYKNSIDAFNQIYKLEGVRGLYKAYGATLASFGPFSAIYFTLYEYFKEYKVGQHKEIDLKDTIICSVSAGAFAAWITNPLDMAKVRMQVVRATKASGAPLFDYKNMLHGISTIYKQEGTLALFQGSLSRVLFHAPSTAITMSLVEYIRNVLQSYHDS